MSDLITGLEALTFAPRGDLKEPSCGYALAGFTFTPADLICCLRSKVRVVANPLPPLPQVGTALVDVPPKNGGESVLEAPWEVSFDPTGPAARFAELWPDTIDGETAERDLCWAPRHVRTLDEAVALILSANS